MGGIVNPLLGSLAHLKATWNDSGDHFDQFLPFIATIIVNRKYKIVDPNILIQDFPREFGFKVPYHPMMTILLRAKEVGLVKKNAAGKFIPNMDAAIRLDFSKESRLHQDRQKQMFFKLKDFAFDRFKISLTIDEAEAGILDLVGSNKNDLIEYAGGKVEVHLRESHKYAAAKFVEHIYSNDHELFQFLADYEVGLALSNSLLHQDITSYKKFTSGLCCYLDTRFILRLTGIEGIDRKLYYEEFVTTLKESGVRLYLHTHVYDEIIGIITESENWIGNSYYDPTKSSFATQYFVTESFSKSDVALFKVQLKSKLSELGVETIDPPLYEDNQQYLCMDENDLYQRIVDNYRDRNQNFDEDEKKYTILRDVRSILSILVYRKGSFPEAMDSAGHIFITLNNSLAYISKVFYSEANQFKFCIPPCITDTFLGALVWINSPSKISTIYEKKIIADCYAALQPSQALLKRFLFELDKLKKMEKITTDQYFMLKTHKTALSLLEDKTYGDPDNVTDKTPEEIFSELKERFKSEERIKLHKVEADHQKTKQDLNNANTYISKLELKASKIARIVSSFTAGCLALTIFVVFAFGLYVSLDSGFQRSLRLPLLVVYSIVTCAATYYGLAIKKVQTGFGNWLSRKLLKLML